METNQKFSIARLFRDAIEVFGNEQEACNWFDEENQSLDGKTPNQVLNSKQGQNKVNRALRQLA